MADTTPLLNHIAGLLERHERPVLFGEDDSPFLSGRLDSIDLVELVMFVEENYGIDLSSEGYNSEEFDTLQIVFRRICLYLREIAPEASGHPGDG